MLNEKIISELTELLEKEGAAKVGFSMPANKLKDIFADTPYAITVLIPLSEKIIDMISGENGPSYIYYHHYRTVNALIDQITLKAVLYLQNNGYNAVAIPASQTIPDKNKPYHSDFSHKTGAVMSGLGWIGRSSLFISRDFGPRVRLGTILTDMELPLSQNIIKENKCSTCSNCVKSCPAKAIKGNMWHEGIDISELVDTVACNEHMRKTYMDIGRGSVCGICMKVCPCR